MNDENTENENSTTPDSVALPFPPPRPNRRMAWKPKEGYEHNPLLTLPRNKPCPCRSGKKFKACCLDKLPRIVSKADADHFAEQMRQPDLVFLTVENAKTMIEDAAKSVTDAP